MKERPLIDYNGVIQQMDDAQYGEYLEMQAKLPPALDVSTPEERIDALTVQVEDLTLLMADIVGGAV